jgi:hypothetical protein
MPVSLYPMDFEGTDAVYLDDVAFRDGEVMHPFGQDDVGTGRHIAARVFVELVTHTDTPHTREDGDVFVDLVPVGRYLRAGSRSNAKDEWRTLFRRVALDDRDLGLTQ